MINYPSHLRMHGFGIIVAATIGSNFRQWYCNLCCCNSRKKNCRMIDVTIMNSQQPFPKITVASLSYIRTECFASLILLRSRNGYLRCPCVGFKKGLQERGRDCSFPFYIQRNKVHLTKVTICLTYRDQNKQIVPINQSTTPCKCSCMILSTHLSWSVQQPELNGWEIGKKRWTKRHLLYGFYQKEVA